MIDRETIVRAVETHCRALTAQDKDGWLRIWADDAVLEDPVGVDTFHGIDALRTTFWALVELTSPLRLAPLEDVIVCGNEAIAILSADSSWGGTTRNVGPLVDHFTFAPDGKIASMRAHWNFAAHGYRPEQATEVAMRQRMVDAIKTHLRASNEGNFDDWIKIWAGDAVVEDPVGAPPHRGIEAIGTTFWSMSRNVAPRLTLTHDVIVCGNEAIAIMSVEVGPPDNRRRLSPVVDHFTFDENAKITGMRAFFKY